MIDLNKESARQHDQLLNLVDRWRKAKGRGSFVNVNDRYKLTNIIIDKMKAVNEVVVICIGDNSWNGEINNINVRYSIVEILGLVRNVSKVITARTERTLIIIDNLQLYNKDELDTILNYYINLNPFLIGYFNDVFKEEDELKYIHIPPLNIIKRVDRQTEHEYYVSITLNKIEQDAYNTHATTVQNIATRFNNDHKLIQSFIVGKSKEGLQGSDCRYEFARSMGWEKELDLTDPYSQEVERLYNPNTIHDVVKDYFETIRVRNKILDNNINKLLELDNLIKLCKEKRKRFIVISDNSEIAISLWNMHSDCGIYCNQTPTVIIDGKKFGKDALKSSAIKAFANNRIPGIITANTLDHKFNVYNVDVVIYTSPFCPSVDDILDEGRVTQFDVNSSNISIWLYIQHSRQEARMTELYNLSNKPKTFTTSGFQLSL